MMNIIENNPVKSLAVVIAIGVLIYMALDYSAIYSFFQGFKAGLAGK